MAFAQTMLTHSGAAGRSPRSSSERISVGPAAAHLPNPRYRRRVHQTVVAMAESTSQKTVNVAITERGSNCDINQTVPPERVSAYL